MRYDATVFEVVVHFDSFPPDVFVFLAGSPYIFRQSFILQHCPQRTSWDKVHIVIRLKLLLEDGIGALVDALILVFNSEENFDLSSNGVYDVITYRTDLLLSNGLIQLLKNSLVSLSVYGECHPSYEANREERKEFAELTLLNLAENSGTESDKGLILA